MITHGGFEQPYVMRHFLVTGSLNTSRVNDPLVEKLFADVQANYWDPAAVAKIYNSPIGGEPDFTSYAHSQAWWLVLPSPYRYTFWQPWVNNYEGVSSIAYNNTWDAVMFIWIDQELKESMGR